jgi:hypothetical protein
MIGPLLVWMTAPTVQMGRLVSDFPPMPATSAVEYVSHMTRTSEPPRPTLAPPSMRVPEE